MQSQKEMDCLVAIGRVDDAHRRGLDHAEPFDPQHAVSILQLARAGFRCRGERLVHPFLELGAAFLGNQSLGQFRSKGGVNLNAGPARALW